LNLQTVVLRTWASEGFFQGGAPGDFSNIFPWGAKSGEICFFPLENKKTTFFAETFKIQGGGSPCLTPFQRP